MRADLVVSAVGQANFITPGMVKPDAIIIDVGINFDENGKLVGDAAVPGQSTPVPGGVGLLTRLAVLENIISLTTGGNYYGKNRHHSSCGGGAGGVCGDGHRG